MQAEATPIVRPGDRLHVDFTNSAGKPVDLNVLYIDHDYGITLICQAHLAPIRSSVPADGRYQRQRQVGSERIVAIVNESGKDLTDLSFLTQRGIVQRTRGPEEQGLLGMIADLGAGVPTRGPTALSLRDTKTPRGAVVMVPVEALERHRRDAGRRNRPRSNGRAGRLVQRLMPCSPAPQMKRPRSMLRGLRFSVGTELTYSCR